MSGSQRHPQSLMTWLDALAALVITLSAVLYGNSARFPSGSLTMFLHARVTISNAIFAAVFVFVWRQCFKDLHRYHADVYDITRTVFVILRACIVLTVLLGIYLLAAHPKGPTFHVAWIFFLVSSIYEVSRVIGGGLLRVRLAARDPEVVIILGSGPRAGKAWRRIRTRYYSTMKLLGFVDSRDTALMAPDIADRYLGSLDELSDLLMQNAVDRMIVAMPLHSCYESIQRAIAIAEGVGVQVIYLQDFFSSTRSSRPASEHELFKELAPVHESYVTRQAFKRAIDIAGAIFGLVALAPLLVLIGIAVRITSPGPALFVQERYGHRRRLFRMVKFRSMVEDAPQLMASVEHLNEAKGPIFKIRNDPRVTPLGRILRMTSLDELPQLWNVLLGDMSLVGPRPMSVRDVKLFTNPSSMRRFSVKPGMTGLWQVNGRSSVGFDQWLSMDFKYIDRWSLRMDMVILARTVTAVVKRSDAA